MTKLQAIKKIQSSNADQNVKDALCIIVSEWDLFLKIKKKYQESGLMSACYEQLGVKFLGLYGLNTLEDAVRKAKENNLLA